MTSKLKIEKTCNWCKKTFTARTTTTRFCSHICNSRAYKDRKRNEKIRKHSQQQVPKVPEHVLEILNSKEYLKVMEASALLGLSRQSIYNLIHKGQLKASKISPRITLIKRSDIDQMFIDAKSAQVHPAKSEEKDKEYYSASEIKDKFSVGETYMYRILKEKKIPNLKKGQYSYYSKTHVDRHFKKYNPSAHEEIKDWATIQELCDELKLTESAFYSLISRGNIPKKREKRKRLYSRQHVLMERGLIEKKTPEYYTSQEAMNKYDLSRDSLYGLLKTYNITKIKDGRYIKISKMELDNLLNPKNRIP